MSSNRRRPSPPESHLTEFRLAEAPARAWPGSVRLTSSDGTLDVPGVWHLALPQGPRPMAAPGRTALALPAPGDHAAWREYLVRLVSLQVPGTQLRVRAADAEGWHTLEWAAATSPASVLQLDRDGLRGLLGDEARISLTVTTGAGP